VNLQLTAIYYFMGDFLKARDHLNQAKNSIAELSATLDPRHMIAHALLTYKIQSTLAPDHSSEEYLSIAHRYVDRFGLEQARFSITLAQLEHLLLTGRFEEAWQMVDDLAQSSADLPATHLERHLFLCFAVRAAWEMEQRAPRGWLIHFRRFTPAPDAPFILQTHWALAIAAEALLPLSSSGAQASESLKSVGDLLVKLKLKYYYRAVLGKHILLAQKLGSSKLEDLRQLKEKLDKSFGITLAG
jgi:hypothetical protein